MSCVPFDPDYACCDDWDSHSPELKERATDLAWATLRLLTGQQVGNCIVTVRPCTSQPCNLCSSWGRPLTPWVQASLREGNWFNCMCGTPECSCERLCEIVMPGPIAALVEVNFDGCELELDKFRVDNGNRIVRNDGLCWPSCQNMGAELGECGTLGITYIPGVLPDSSGLWAAGILACEFAKACTGSKCRLPSSVTSISRQGVSFTMAGSMFDNGLTGIREVDAYILTVNPHGLVIPPTVWSPDVPWVKHRYPAPTVRIAP